VVDIECIRDWAEGVGGFERKEFDFSFGPISRALAAETYERPNFKPFPMSPRPGHIPRIPEEAVGILLNSGQPPSFDQNPDNGVPITEASLPFAPAPFYLLR